MTCDVPYGLNRALKGPEYFIVGEFRLEPLKAGYSYTDLEKTVPRKSMGKKQYWALLLFCFENEEEGFKLVDYWDFVPK